VSTTNTNINSHVSETIAALTHEQRLGYEKRLEDEYVSGELSWSFKKGEILKTWANLLIYYVNPPSMISSYIKNRLRMRGLSEGQIDHVSRVLDPEFKDPRFDTYRNRDASASLRAEVFENYDEIATQAVDLRSLEKSSSTAEQYEIITRRKRHIKGIRQKLSDENDLLTQFAIEHDIKIPELQKESALEPPPEFWGDTVATDTLDEFAHELGVIKHYVEDTSQLMKKFKPAEEISQKIRDYILELRNRVLVPMTKQMFFVCRGYRDILGMPSDAKNAALLLDWMKIGIDKYVNAGSRGAGVLNAIKTGQHYFKLGKEPNTVYEIEVEREFTREQVGDKAAKILLMQARDILMQNECEQALQSWAKNTNVEITLQDAQTFYKRAIKKEAAKR
jgi:hypothetical protein